MRRLCKIYFTRPNGPIKARDVYYDTRRWSEHQIKTQLDLFKANHVPYRLEYEEYEPPPVRTLDEVRAHFDESARNDP